MACIAARKELDIEVKQKISDLIRQSIDYAFRNYPSIPDYTKQHAQAMDENVMRQHIELYVNNYSLDLGEEGKAAIRKFENLYSQTSTSVNS